MKIGLRIWFNVYLIFIIFRFSKQNKKKTQILNNNLKMEMEFSVSKRKRESSTSIKPNSRMATKLTMRKLDFSASEAFSSPVHVDDNSCGKKLIKAHYSNHLSQS